MKKQILSVLLILHTVSTQTFPPIKDIALTTVAATGIFGGASLGYWLGGLDKEVTYHTSEDDSLIKWVYYRPATTQDKVFATLFFTVFGTIATVPFTVPFTSYYKFWKAKRAVKKILLHDLFLQYDLDQIERIDLDQLFEILNTRWDAYPLASSFDVLSEWSKKIKESIRLYNEVKYANEAKSLECNERVAALCQINNVLVSVRDRIQNDDKDTFDRQMKLFLEEKRIEELRRLQQELRWNNSSAHMNVHYVHSR